MALVLALLGVALLLTGVALIYVPAALVLGGLACLWVARAAWTMDDPAPAGGDA